MILHSCGCSYSCGCGCRYSCGCENYRYSCSCYSCGCENYRHSCSCGWHFQLHKILIGRIYLYPSFNSFYIFIMYIMIMLLNYFEKVLIFKPIYKLLGKTNIPIFGRGLRPEGANSCNFILDGK